ncbi:MAG: diguanylate cyclase, partial [Desulfuromonadales bacterium]|nr:diguanylate cyclase [Desulfuromonadales bacterium]
QIGRILLNEFRNSDVIARLGGDEFCVLLTGTPASNIERPMQNLDEGFKRWNQEVPYEIGYSVGAVTYDPAIHRS